VGSAGAITDSGNVAVTGAATLTTINQSVTLDAAGNGFAGSFNANTGTGALTGATVSLTSSTAGVTFPNGGSQTLPGTQPFGTATVSFPVALGDVQMPQGGMFTVTVSDTQTAKTVRQIQNGAGDFTLNGGTLVVTSGNGLRADRGTFTVNSVVASSTNPTLQLNAATGAVLIVGGNNTYTATSDIRGVAGGTVRLNNAGALGTGSSVQFVDGSVLLDLNGFDVSGKTITVNASHTGFLGNTAATKSIWSGNVTLTNTGGLLLPQRVRFTFRDGSHVDQAVPVEMWRGDAAKIIVPVYSPKELVRVDLDPDRLTPDASRKDNVFDGAITTAPIQPARADRDDRGAMAADGVTIDRTGNLIRK
jgi:hypothetical protein